jgi:hypothetical protein
MADVSVEFGAKDTGLEQTLKTVQGQLVALDSELKSGTLSFDEINKKMREAAQAEKLHQSLGGTKDQIEALGLSFRRAQPEVTSLGNNSKEMGAKVEQSGKDAQAAGSMFDQSFKKIAAAFAVGNIAAKGFEMAVNAVFSAARAVVDGFGEALDLGARLNALSQQTGESAGKVLVLETAFKNAHISADQVGTTINRLQNFMAQAEDSGSKQASTMDKLGISMADLAGKTPTQQMEVFAERISAIEDPTQRVAAATDVFGQRLGGRLLPLFNDFSANLDDARGKVGSLEQVMDENAATFDAAGNTIDAIKGKFAAFAAGLLSETIPAVQDLGTSMEQVDAAGLGQKIGSALNPVLKDLSGLVYDAGLLIDGLAYAEQQAREDTGALGVAFNAVDGALKGFNQALIDGLRFITPFDETLDALEKTFVGTKAGVEGAADAIDEFGDQATDAASEVDKLGESLGGIPPKLDDIAEAENNIKSAIQDQADEKKKSIQHQIDLNRAIAEGNVEEQSRIQALIDAEKAQERILRLTEQYIATGLGSEEAEDLARNLVKSETAAKGVEASMKRTAGAVREVTVQSDGQTARLEEQQRILSGQLETERRILEARANGNEELVKQIKSQERFNKLVDDLIKSGQTLDSASAIASKMIENEIKALEMEAAKRGASSSAGGGAARATPPAPSRGKSMAAQMAEQIKETERLKKVDPGMFNKSVQSVFDNFQKALSEGRTGAAESQLKQIEKRMRRVDRDQRIAERTVGDKLPNFQELRKEAERLNREFKGGKEEFGDFSKISKMSSEELKDFVDNMQSQTDELRKEGAPSPGDPGARPKEAPEGQSPMDKLSSAVEAIKAAVEKIEPKLPQQALA